MKGSGAVAFKPERVDILAHHQSIGAGKLSFSVPAFLGRTAPSPHQTSRVGRGSRRRRVLGARSQAAVNATVTLSSMHRKLEGCRAIQRTQANCMGMPCLAATTPPVDRCRTGSEVCSPLRLTRGPIRERGGPRGRTSLQCVSLISLFLYCVTEQSGFQSGSCSAEEIRRKTLLTSPKP